MSHLFAMATCLSLALGFASASDGPFWATAIDLGRGKVGASSAIMNPCGNIGGFLAPILTPLIAGYAGWSWGLYFGAGVVLVGAIAWFLIDPTPPRISTWPKQNPWGEPCPTVNEKLPFRHLAGGH